MLFINSEDTSCIRSHVSIHLSDEIVLINCCRLSCKTNGLLLKYAEELLMEDKRSSVRKACQVPINFASQNQIFTDQIKDISKSGLFIETNKPLFVGERV